MKCRVLDGALMGVGLHFTLLVVGTNVVAYRGGDATGFVMLESWRTLAIYDTVERAFPHDSLARNFACDPLLFVITATPWMICCVGVLCLWKVLVRGVADEGE